MINTIAFSNYRSLPFFIIILAGYWMSKDNPYFWDTVQFGSEHAHWYYNHKFAYFLLPESMDSGHPPLFGMYIAVWWMLFGKALWVSHLAMLPFTLFSLFLLLRVGDKILGKRYSPFLVLLCIADPVIAAQHILVSPDIVVFSGTLLTLCGILEKRKLWIITGTLLLGSISMRGMMVACALGMYELIVYMIEEKEIRMASFKNYIRIFLPYFPAVLFFSGFLFYHYVQCGWIGYHENSPWASSFERVGWAGMLRNILVAVFRFLEFGRIGLVVALLILLVYVQWKTLRYLLLLFGLLVVCLIIPQLFYRELLGTRYLIPLFLVLNILFIKILFENNYKESIRFRNWYAGSIVLILLSGNFWRYPNRMAMGWDASLGHVFYFQARQQMLDYIDRQKIPFSEIASSFPEYGPLENLDLNGDLRSMQPLDLKKHQYVYYSNVMNLSDEVFFTLEQQYLPLQEYVSGTVKVILYKRKNNF